MANRRPTIPLFTKLLLLFTIVPLVELFLLIKLAQMTTIWFTIAVILLSGFLGAAMVKREGFFVLRRAQEEATMGRFPADALMDGILLLMGGALLLTPGILTDILGFSTLIPAARAAIKALLYAKFRDRVTATFASGGARGMHVRFGGRPAAPPPPYSTPTASEPHDPQHDPFEKPSPFDRVAAKR